MGYNLKKYISELTKLQTIKDTFFCFMGTNECDLIYCLIVHEIIYTSLFVQISNYINYTN